MRTTSVLISAFRNSMGTQEYASHLLSAHETLTELLPENAKEFVAVIHYLKSDLESHSSVRY
ncbi:hypothetical protein CSA56_11785 [candidate division KSB3 bacterium]|uniref:Uncharacterized protein n=1 Tax=candidate division KSB3 bacterium TaxID=2044937 RepID=A0A2G6KCT9_9BACT|nr:MAG: hypothetical protein CSA56_11785 [candidate division KSB3 bacterium]